ncbi:TetR family transcriptional regulator [Amycolatopsis sp. PS_44_ISF1]|uniref:TetR/AcrR family transcriptional regulator n=1 Tax=Amycolatopsis sp. PS_44_ISF1 TaxID=2974917 RepID=UPI0028E063E1|nr:TetR family transcriptional regulator [Amycolatopsis sp. PS_44_ISF1]MDT8910065.1 TetR family transcriptional regulator [Amycolatopsis sp. PS_44_ISF1]
MPRTPGLRERKKAQTRQHIADTAALLFAEHGYEGVSVADVAAAAEVSGQTVYNYFPVKPDFVLDRAEEFRERLVRAITVRPAGTSPAHALRELVHVDIERHRGAVLEEARGQFPALYASSAVLRQAGLQMYEEQAVAAAAAIVATCPAVPPAVARAHAAALVSVFQLITDRTGHGVLAATPPDVVADELVPQAAAVLDDLDRHFHQIIAHTRPDHTVPDHTAPAL